MSMRVKKDVPVCAKLPSRPLVFGVVRGLFWLSLVFLVGEGSAMAQEPPPFPVLYGGRLLIDGEPAPPGIEVMARVGDYETSTVVEVGEEGRYRNLVVQPPNSEYYELPVTFHALGTTALEQDVFKRSGGPVVKATGDAAFDLHFQLPLEAEPEETPTVAGPMETPIATSVEETPTAAGGSDGGGGLPVPFLVGIVAAGLAVAVGVWVFRRRKMRGGSA